MLPAPPVSSVAFQILDRVQHSDEVVAQLADAQVALSTKPATELARRMAVIESQPSNKAGFGPATALAMLWHGPSWFWKMWSTWAVLNAGAAC